MCHVNYLFSNILFLPSVVLLAEVHEVHTSALVREVQPHARLTAPPPRPGLPALQPVRLRHPPSLAPSLFSLRQTFPSAAATAAAAASRARRRRM